MKGVITATHILFSGFLGIIIGGAIIDNTAMWVSGLVLLILDIIIGIALQYFYERNVKLANNYEKEWPDFMQDLKNRFETGKKSISDRLYNLAYGLLHSGGKQEIKSMNDEAAQLLVDICNQMPHAPSRAMLSRVNLVATADIGELGAVVYTFVYQPYSVGQIALIFLVEAEVEQFRFFTVETTFSTQESGPRFMLCEYADGKHLNYGFIELARVPERIEEIIHD